MKTSSQNIHVTRKLVAGIAIGASLLVAGMTAVLATETKHLEPGLLKKAEQWENKMSEVFRDAWKSLRAAHGDASVTTESVSLREHRDNYTVRLNLPNRDLEKVRIALQGDTLHIVAPDTGKSGRYEEIVTLVNAVPNATPQIDRRSKDDMIVVTIPRNVAAAEANRLSLPPDPLLLPPSDWDRDYLGRMDKMNRDMDKIFDESFREFRIIPEHVGIFDAPRFSSSVDLKDDGSNFVVHAYLPQHEIKDVNVTAEGRTLKIAAKAEESTGQPEHGNGFAFTRKEQFSQDLTLPGPVQAAKMKVERKAGMITVTLPKT